MNLTSKIAFIGFGNMARALAEGAIKAGVLKTNNIIVSSPSLCDGTKSTPFMVAKNNLDAANNSEIIILGTKPNTIQDVCNEISETLLEKKNKPLIVSIAAGVTTQAIQHHLRYEKMPVARVMPNTPVSVGLGASGFYANPFVTPDHIKLISSIMESTGIMVTVSAESDLDKITALSGSGPAYFLLLQEMLTRAAEKLGLSHDVASRLVAQTMLGTGVLTKTNKLGFEASRKLVTSKGGTTAAAVDSFIAGGIEELVHNAVFSAHERAVELRKTEVDPAPGSRFFQSVTHNNQSTSTMLKRNIPQEPIHLVFFPGTGSNRRIFQKIEQQFLGQGVVFHYEFTSKGDNWGEISTSCAEKLGKLIGKRTAIAVGHSLGASMQL